MAYGSIEETINCRYTGTDFTIADVDAGVVAQVADAAAADNGWARPRIIKAPTGTGVTGNMLGVVQTVEVPSTSNRAPSGTRICAVAYQGILKTKKTEDPEAADVGKYVALDTTAGRTAGGVTTSDTASNGLVVGITGTESTDFLIVKWS